MEPPSYQKRVLDIYARQRRWAPIREQAWNACSCSRYRDGCRYFALSQIDGIYMTDVKEEGLFLGVTFLDGGYVAESRWTFPLLRHNFITTTYYERIYPEAGDLHSQPRSYSTSDHTAQTTGWTGSHFPWRTNFGDDGRSLTSQYPGIIFNPGMVFNRLLPNASFEARISP